MNTLAFAALVASAAAQTLLTATPVPAVEPAVMPKPKPMPMPPVEPVPLPTPTEEVLIAEPVPAEEEDSVEEHGEHDHSMHDAVPAEEEGSVEEHEEHDHSMHDERLRVAEDLIAMFCPGEDDQDDDYDYYYGEEMVGDHGEHADHMGGEMDHDHAHMMDHPMPPKNRGLSSHDNLLCENARSIWAELNNFNQADEEGR